MKRNIIFIVAFLAWACACRTSRDNKTSVDLPVRPPVKCYENSPERKGEEGCSILSNRPLTGPLTGTLFWHIDEFDSIETARRSAGPNAVAEQAHGRIWLMSVELNTNDHHGGRHIALLGPLELPASENVSMRVQSSNLLPGTVTPVHTHSGPETFYIVDGAQCIERENDAISISSGQTFVVPKGTIHRGRVIGNVPRRALTLILYDSKFPSSHDFDTPPVLKSCK
jgi:quercetin dioxygenase-like cupin family protein